MTNVQGRDVPDDVLEQLNRRAASQGLRLQRYLRCVLEAEAGVGRNDNLLDEAAADPGNYRATEGEAAEEVRRARDERDRRTRAL